MTTDAFDLELRLDRVEAAALAAPAPSAMAQARAYATGQAIASSPEVFMLAASLRTAIAALDVPQFEGRARRILAFGFRAAIEAQADVAAMRAGATTWAGMAALARTRTAACQRLLGCDYATVAARIDGADRNANGAAIKASDDGSSDTWRVKPLLPYVSLASVAAVVALAQRRNAARGAKPFEIFVVESLLTPRTFADASGVAIVVPSSPGTVSAWSHVLHECGHAVAALEHGIDTPRVLDEAFAIANARQLDDAEWVLRAWDVDAATARRIAAAARAGHDRQGELAATLVSIEEALYAGDAVSQPPPFARVPAAFVDDPAMQPAYAVAAIIAKQGAPEVISLLRGKTT